MCVAFRVSYVIQPQKKIMKKYKIYYETGEGRNLSKTIGAPNERSAKAKFKRTFAKSCKIKKCEEINKI